MQKLIHGVALIMLTDISINAYISSNKDFIIILFITERPLKRVLIEIDKRLDKISSVSSMRPTI